VSVEQVAAGVIRFHRADAEYADHLRSDPGLYVLNRRNPRGHAEAHVEPEVVRDTGDVGAVGNGADRVAAR
jgi:hypothetical protein